MYAVWCVVCYTVGGCCCDVCGYGYEMCMQTATTTTLCVCAMSTRRQADSYEMYKPNKQKKKEGNGCLQSCGSIGSRLVPPQTLISDMGGQCGVGVAKIRATRRVDSSRRPAGGGLESRGPSMLYMYAQSSCPNPEQKNVHT